jgi:hypothetical protein
VRESVVRKRLGLLVAAALVAAMTAFAVVPVFAEAADTGPLATLKANLRGEKEVPGPGDPDGRGSAVVKVFRAKVCYTLTAKRIAPPGPEPGAHIHLGLRGEAGPVVAPLKPPTDGSSSGCVEITRALSLELREHPARYYVNVHNEPYPAGAIRGQLYRS